MNLPNEKFPLKILMFLENKHIVGGIMSGLRGREVPDPVGYPSPGKCFEYIRKWSKCKVF